MMVGPGDSLKTLYMAVRYLSSHRTLQLTGDPADWDETHR